MGDPTAEPAAPPPEVRRLLLAYHDVLAESSAAGAPGGPIKLPGGDWFARWFVTRRIRSALGELAGQLRRSAAAHDDATELAGAALVDEFLGGVPDLPHTRLVFGTLVAAFALGLAVLASAYAPGLLDALAAGVTLDGPAFARAVGGVNPQILFDAVPLLALAGAILALPLSGYWAERRHWTQERTLEGDQGTTTVAALEDLVFGRVGARLPAELPLDVALGAGAVVVLFSSFYFLIVDTADYRFRLGYALVPILETLVLLVIALLAFERDGRSPSRGTWIRLALAASVIASVPVLATGRVARSQEPRVELTAVAVREHDVTLGAFLDEGRADRSAAPVPGQLHLDDYQARAGRPADARSIRTLTGIVVGYTGTERASMPCLCSVVATLYDADSRRRVPGAWNRTRWALGYESRTSQTVTGQVWLPNPPAGRSYFVKLEVVVAERAARRSEVPSTRDIEGPVQVVLRSGEALDPYFIAYRRLTGLDTESFELT